MVYNLAEKTILLLDNNLKTPKFINVENFTNSVIMKGEFILSDSSSLSGKLNLALKANANPYFSVYKDASSIKQLITGGINANDISSFNTVQLSPEMSNVHCDIKKDEAFKEMNTYLSFELPYATNGLDSWHINLLTAQRNSSLEIPETIHERYQYSIELPDDIKPILKATNFEINNEVGHLLIKIEKTGNKLLITKDIKITQKVIDLDKYNDFREIMNNWNNNKYRQILFRKR